MKDASTASPLALRIKELRAQKRITQKQLAEKTGIAYSTVIGYENSKREPNSKAMTALENYFGVSGSYLRGETNQKEPPFKWDDPELVEAGHDAFPPVLKKLSFEIEQCSPKHQKLIFDILAELHNTISKESDVEKDALIESLHAGVENAILGKKKSSVPAMAETEDDIFDRLSDAEVDLFTSFLFYRGIGDNDNITPTQIGMLKSAALILDTAFPLPEARVNDLPANA